MYSLAVFSALSLIFSVKISHYSNRIVPTILLEVCALMKTDFLQIISGLFHSHLENREMILKPLVDILFFFSNVFLFDVIRCKLSHN